jgi:hypothetical protein
MNSCVCGRGMAAPLAGQVTLCLEVHCMAVTPGILLSVTCGWLSLANPAGHTERIRGTSNCSSLIMRQQNSFLKCFHQTSLAAQGEMKVMKCQARSSARDSAAAVSTYCPCQALRLLYCAIMTQLPVPVPSLPGECPLICLSPHS